MIVVHINRLINQKVEPIYLVQKDEYLVPRPQLQLYLSLCFSEVIKTSREPAESWYYVKTRH